MGLLCPWRQERTIKDSVDFEKSSDKFRAPSLDSLFTVEHRGNFRICNSIGRSKKTTIFPLGSQRNSVHFINTCNNCLFTKIFHFTREQSETRRKDVSFVLKCMHVKRMHWRTMVVISFECNRRRSTRNHNFAKFFEEFRANPGLLRMEYSRSSNSPG